MRPQNKTSHIPVAKKFRKTVNCTVKNVGYGKPFHTTHYTALPLLFCDKRYKRFKIFFELVFHIGIINRNGWMIERHNMHRSVRGTRFKNTAMHTAYG